MADLSSFPITQRWLDSYPDRLQLYAAATPNDAKVSTICVRDYSNLQAWLGRVLARPAVQRGLRIAARAA